MRQPAVYLALYGQMRDCPNCTWTNQYTNRACTTHAHLYLHLASELCPHCQYARPAKPRRHCTRCDWLTCHCGRHYRTPPTTRT